MSEEKPRGLDLSRLRLSQNFTEMTGVKRLLVTVPVRKPAKHEFFRLHVTEHLETAMLRIKEDRDEVFLVDPELWSHLASDIAPYAIFLCMSRQGIPFVWPIRLPAENGRHDSWGKSALEAASQAKTNWVRMAANMSLGAYEIFVAESDLGSPDWPEKSFAEILDIAFKDHFIRDLEHPAIQRLRGKL